MRRRSRGCSLWLLLATGAIFIPSASAASTTSAASDAEGGHCDCSTQGRWQPLFKPSQILHSEFPEHKYSDSTGGPRPTQLRTVKILPHLVVPLINPLAISIHHQHQPTDDQQQHSYNDLNTNNIDSGVRKKKKKSKNKLKHENYDYAYPYYKGPTNYDEEYPSIQRPYSDVGGGPHSFEEHYHNDSQEQVDNFDDGPHQDERHHHDDGPDQDQHYHHDDVSTESGGNTSGEDTRSYEATGSSALGPDPTSSDPTHDDHYNSHNTNYYNYNNNDEEGSTMSPYYNSEEYKEQAHDSSKYSPHIDHNNGYRYNGIKGGGKKHIYRDVNKYYGSKTRGKAMRYPMLSNSHVSSDSGYKSSPSLKYKHVKRPPKALTFNRQAVPATLHSDLYHPPPPPPPPPPSPPHSVPSPTPARVLPDRAPIYHAHPPLAILTPLKIILREEAKRITLLRPPVPGMHHTWTFDAPLSRSNEIALLKKPRMLYVMKTVPHDPLSLIK
ncbi:myb-like protein F [Nilaparvata lugens]|uniref:myb-like protein F n=1 Tax=Nilaparvata lugens TaxID=108931 RepID=UPI00193EBC58|nr:myb-like protein F [Nilaparvata lugens]